MKAKAAPTTTPTPGCTLPPPLLQQPFAPPEQPGELSPAPLKLQEALAIC